LRPPPSLSFVSENVSFYDVFKIYDAFRRGNIILCFRRRLLILHFSCCKNQTSQTHNMAVLWQDTCRGLQRLCKFRCVATNSNVNKTRAQSIHSNTTQVLINGTLRYYMFRFLRGHYTNKKKI